MNEFVFSLIIVAGYLFMLYALCCCVIRAKQQRDCKHINQHRYSNLRVCLDCGKKAYGPIE